MVLTDDKEALLLERAGLTSSERISFHIAGPTSDRLQKRVGRWLEYNVRQQPRDFELDYVERRGLGPEDLPKLRALVDAYSRSTGRALWGWPQDVPHADKISAATWLGQRPDAAFITLTTPNESWGRKRYVTTALLAFLSAEIEKFAGTDQEFVLITSSIAHRFGSDLMRIISGPDLRDEELP